MSTFTGSIFYFQYHSLWLSCSKDFGNTELHLINVASLWNKTRRATSNNLMVKKIQDSNCMQVWQ